MAEKNYKQIHNTIKNIGIDTLEKSNLLENIVKELLISQLIENIQMDEGESNEILDNFIEKNGLKNEKKELNSFKVSRKHINCTQLVQQLH